jgi:EAL domain-containing protein (putative c-di-GMP-specific phosphodiesterase class I)
MAQVELAEQDFDWQHEGDRMAALAATGILDTPPEPAYDAITRLAAEYFRADTVLLGFADVGRVWIKSYWGEPVRELPRDGSIFDRVLAEDGPIVVPDTSKDSLWAARRVVCRRLRAYSFASAPVRSFGGHILGALTIFGSQPRRNMSRDELHMLESLADMAANQLELRRMRRTMERLGPTLLHARPAHSHKSPVRGWPRKPDLRAALEQRQFELYYQPEIEIATRRVIGLEALIRWRHPERGLLEPTEFIPAAEESGMILPIGDWVLSRACQQIQQWNRELPALGSVRVCVNLSAPQFAREGLADHVEALLMRNGIASGQLGLEMTESSLVSDKNTALDVLHHLRKLGVSLLIDDFGTGYSSLQHLHAFPFDVLKIDRSFVNRMTQGEQPMQIVRTILELARVLGMDVVAEGIETRAQHEMLADLHCHCGQGYFYARPMSAEAVTEVLCLPEHVLPDPDSVAVSVSS